MTTSDNKLARHPYKRYAKNLIIDRNFQFKIGLYFFALGFALTGAFCAIVVFKLNKMESSFIAASLLSGDQVYLLQSVINEIIFGMFSVYVVFIVFTLGYSIIISHRIAGPVVAICNFIEELKKGNFDYARKLRKYDDLQPIMDKLHQLAAHLKKNKK